MRLFVAIELPGQMRAELARIQSALKQLSCGGRFVPARNMHLTLHFIGETSDLHGAVSAVQKSVRGIRPFELHLGRYNCFQRGASRTSIVEVKGGLSELNALYESLQYAMSDNGFPRERKGYVPHITLGRNVSHDDLVEAELRDEPLNASMRVNSITLFESTRLNAEMVYSVLHREKFL